MQTRRGKLMLKNENVMPLTSTLGVTKQTGLVLSASSKNTKKNLKGDVTNKENVKPLNDPSRSVDFLEGSRDTSRLSKRIAKRINNSNENITEAKPVLPLTHNLLESSRDTTTSNLSKTVAKSINKRNKKALKPVLKPVLPSTLSLAEGGRDTLSSSFSKQIAKGNNKLNEKCFSPVSKLVLPSTPNLGRGLDCSRDTTSSSFSKRISNRINKGNRKSCTPVSKSILHSTVGTKGARKNIDVISTHKGVKRNIAKEVPSSTATNRKLMDFSLKVLDDNHLDHSCDKDAIYEFTFDPTQEPPKKKKRKQAVRKKAKPQSKALLPANKIYEMNMSSTMQTLKSKLNKGNAKKSSENKENDTPASCTPGNAKFLKAVEATSTPKCLSNITNTALLQKNISHIVNDFVDPDENLNINLDYSPAPQCLTPEGKKSCVNETRDQLRVTRAKSLFRPEINPKDPLNLLAEASFDDVPVASSSLNTSARHPEASPWRVEFNNLPIKWQVNSYTKANMTPAVETSFVNFNDSQKKHVYTNLVPEAEETLPDIVDENHGVQLKQTSLIDFLKDAAEKSLKKKRRPLKDTDIPSRANLPKTALNFCPSSEVVNKMYNELKTASEAPPVLEPCQNVGANEANGNESLTDNDESQSCHLFEEVDAIHHVKPTRKSYTRAKKVTFIRPITDSILPMEDMLLDLDKDEEAEQSDTTFELPNVKNKKHTKKKKVTKQSKKEKDEVDAWAAAFNSMCEDVDDFELVIE